MEMSATVALAKQSLKAAIKIFAGQNGFVWKRKFYERTMADLSQRIWLEKVGPSFNLYVYFLVGEELHTRTNKFDGDAEYHPGHFSGRHPEHAKLMNPEYHIGELVDFETYLQRVLAFLEDDVRPVLDQIQSQDALAECLSNYKKWRALGVFGYMSTYDRLDIPRPGFD